MNIVNRKRKKAVDIARLENHWDVVALLSIRMYPCPDGWLPLHYAAAKGNLVAVQALAVIDDYVTEQDAHGKTAVEYAYEKVHIEIIQYLELRMRQIDPTGHSAVTTDTLTDVVMRIVAEDDKEKRKKLLEHAEMYRILWNNEHEQRNTTLVSCLASENVECVRNLLAFVARRPHIPLDPNASFIDTSNVRIHPLDYIMNHLRNTRLLTVFLKGIGKVANCFDANVRDEITGETALMSAITDNNLDMVKHFVQLAIQSHLFVDLEVLDHSGNDIFMLANAMQNPEMITYLTDQRSDLKSLERYKPFECFICYFEKKKSDEVVLPCRHGLCRDCESRMAVKSHGRKECPMCRGRY